MWLHISICLGCEMLCICYFFTTTADMGHDTCALVCEMWLDIMTSICLGPTLSNLLVSHDSFYDSIDATYIIQFLSKLMLLL
jgi:hypothetical protein